jgi:hypothetical protein
MTGPTSNKFLLPRSRLVAVIAAGAAAIGLPVLVVAAPAAAATRPTHAAPVRAVGSVRGPYSAGALRWTVSKSLKRRNPEYTPEFSAVTATGPGNAWAFLNGKPVAWHLVSGRWSSVRFPNENTLITYAAASGPRDVWAFGLNNTAYRFNGARWAVAHTFPRKEGIISATVIGRTDVYAFILSSAGPITWHYNGRGWRQVRAARGLIGASAVSPSNIWAVGESVAHFTDGKWHKTPVKSLLPKKDRACPDLTAVYAQSASSVWALDSSGCDNNIGPLILLHYTGGHWHVIQEKVANVNAATLIPDGRGGLWIATEAEVVTPSYLLHFSDGKFTKAKQPVAGYYAIAGLAHAPRSTVSYAVGAAAPQAVIGPADRAVILQNKS